MHIRVQHETTYTYEDFASYSVQALRCKPQDTRAQKLLHWRFQVPNHASITEGEDAYGNILNMLYVTRPHNSVTVKVTGEVETTDTGGVLTGITERFVPIFYLRTTELTAADPAIEALAREVKSQTDGSDLDTAHQLMHAVRDAVDYRTGETHVATSAAQALAHGLGVCQDHAHIFIAAMRRVGIPARYISGYLRTANDDEYDAGHAWAEAYIDDLGWVGFDVANRICPTEAYIRVASGLDYLEASPVRGFRRGGGEENLGVRLRVGDAAQQ